jgi:CMP-2-keto-3-deoxyoctulosonic acid synthetase
MLPENPDGSFRLPKSYEQQMLVDTMGVKKRIADAISIYGSEEELNKYDADRQTMLKRDRDYLDKLRHMYKGNSIVVNEYEA